MPIVSFPELKEQIFAGLLDLIFPMKQPSPKVHHVEDRRPSNSLTNAAFIIENHGKHPQAKYDLGKTNLGEGGFGTVCLGIDRKSKAVRAIKTVPKAKIPVETRFKSEIDIMKAMDHPNIIKLYETFEDQRNFYLAMELCEGGEMFDFIIDHGPFSQGDVAIVMRQVLRAVFYMHNKGVVHRDLKPENFLLDSKGSISEATLKIIDFGMSCCWVQGDRMMTRMVGSPSYVAPEVLKGSYGNEVDVWSCAVIMFIILCGSPPFGGKTDADILKNVLRADVTFKQREWRNVSSSAKEMITQMLARDPRKRITAEHALSHSFLQTTSPRGNDVKLPETMVRNLEAFREVDRFKKAALHVIAQHLNTAQIGKLREVFVKLDVNEDGQLTQKEIMDGITALGGSLPSDFMEVLMGIDTDGSGLIDYTEFLAASIDRKLYCQEHSCWEAFCTFDLDGDGAIAIDELSKAVAHIPGDVAIHEMSIEDLMSQWDLNKDGVIDFSEFKAMMESDEVKRTPLRPLTRPKAHSRSMTYNLTIMPEAYAKKECLVTL
jgi:calcium-dependent protein kinase